MHVNFNVNSGNLTGPAAVVASVIWIIILIVFLIVWFKAAKNMAKIARDKGYEERKWFHYCFWLGLFGYLMVIAMPDKKGRSSREADSSEE